MSPKSLLVANRGEIAIRVTRAAAELGMRTVAVFSEDDARSLHTRKSDEARALSGTGAKAYLDAEQIVALARAAGCDAIHPGYGFLSENAAFARRCAEEGITFVGPRPETLDTFGDKARARALAERCGVAVVPGSSGPTSLDEARAFLESLGDGGSMVIKAISGGGGRGMRTVHRPADVAEAYARCQSEAQAAFGTGEVYVERWIPRARHIEVQVVGDGSGGVSHLWERECSIQRRNQKVVEVAPSPGLSPDLRARLTSAAVRLAEAYPEISGAVNCREITGQSVITLREKAQYMREGKAQQCGRLLMKWANRTDTFIDEALTEFEGCDPSPSCTNCAVETFKRIASDDELARSGSTYVAGLAGGVGLLGRSCAALTVGILALTLRHYAARRYQRRDSRVLGTLHELGLARFRKQPARLLEQFKREFGSDLCSEIVGRLFTSPNDHASFIAEGGCREVIGFVEGRVSEAG